MKLAMTAFTQRGGTLARTLAQGLSELGYVCALAVPAPLAAKLELEPYSALSDWAKRAFHESDALLFVGASGIAVRAIAPYVKDKFTDPAVVSVDEAGWFAVPLLSGHMGGANELARKVAELTSGVAVVSTATDVNGLFAVDEWAKGQGLVLVGRTEAKHISAALLAEDSVTLQSDFPIRGELPVGVKLGHGALGFCVTLDGEKTPFLETLRLVPRILNVGIGCRRDTPMEDITGAVHRALVENHLSPLGIRQICTIDLKKDELGLIAFCRKWDWPLRTWSAEELNEAEGTFTSSEFVRSVTGTDNVCERAAVLGGGSLLVKKRAEREVTVAIAIEPYEIYFGERDT